MVFPPTSFPIHEFLPLSEPGLCWGNRYSAVAAIIPHHNRDHLFAPPAKVHGSLRPPFTPLIGISAKICPLFSMNLMNFSLPHLPFRPSSLRSMRCVRSFPCSKSLCAPFIPLSEVISKSRTGLSISTGLMPFFFPIKSKVVSGFLRAFPLLMRAYTSPRPSSRWPPGPRFPFSERPHLTHPLFLLLVRAIPSFDPPTPKFPNGLSTTPRPFLYFECPSFYFVVRRRLKGLGYRSVCLARPAKTPSSLPLLTSSSWILPSFESISRLLFPPSFVFASFH